MAEPMKCAVVPPPLEDEDDEDVRVEMNRKVAGELDEFENDEEITREAQVAVEKLKTNTEESSLMDEMMAASSAAKKVKERRRAEEERKLNDSFGSGLKERMRANLEKRKEKATVIAALKEQGNQAFQSGRLEDSLQFYSKALKQCASDVTGEAWYEGEKMLHTNTALVLFKLGRFQEAADAADRSLRLDGKWAKAFLWKARSLKSLGESTKGSLCLEKGIGAAGKSSKDGKFLMEEYKKLFPKEFESFSSPMIGVGKGKGTTEKLDGKENNENDQQQQNGLQFPEVQKAMSDLLSTGEWANDNFAKLVGSNPILAKGLQDPRGQVLLKKLQENPRAALQEYGDSPEAQAFIMEMVNVLGQHFTQMGEEDERRRVQEAAPAIMTAEEKEMEKQVEKTLKNEELKSLLMNPETHKVLQECGDPVALNRYMRDPVWGGRLRMMMDNGLVKLER